MEILMTLSNGMVLSKRTESSAPRTAPQNVQEGAYFTQDGKVARVRKSQSSSRLYAEKFNETTLKFEYDRGLVYNLGERMTLAQAKEWGARLGFCCICGTKLTDNRSVDAGIGPVCAKKFAA